MKILFGYICTYSFIIAVFIITNILKKKLNFTNEFARKTIHILVSFTWIIMTYFFSNTLHSVILPMTIVIINYISYKKDIIKIMERKDKKNNSLGTVYYPISMVILALLTIIDKRFMAPYGIGVFCMAFGDGLAPYFSQKYKSRTFRILNNKKTLNGTLTVFICSILVTTIFTIYFQLPLTILEIVFISLSSSILELIGSKGLDNLFLPIGSALISYLLIIF